MRSFRISRTVCALVLAACCALSAVPLRAQDDPDNKPDTPDKPKDKKAWEELIYLPYKNLTRVFDKQDATVFLPYGQFLKLWDAAYPDAMQAHKAPVSAVITDAKYVGKVENNLVRIDATFKVQALDTMAATIGTLETEVSKSQAYLERVQRHDDRVAHGSLDLDGSAGAGH